MPLFAGLCAVLWAATTAAAQQPSPAAASQPASAAVQGAHAANSSVLVQVQFGDKSPGTPVMARLQIPAMNLKIDTDPHGQRALPAMPKGKVKMKVFVAGADPCPVEFDAPGNKALTVKVFVPKRGVGGKCERLED